MYNSNYFQPMYSGLGNYNTQMANTQQQKPNVDWIHTNGINGVKDTIVQPNQTVWLMDNNEPMFYVKSADNLGVTSIRAYRFEEVDLNNNSKESQYVTKDEIDNIIENKLNVMADKLMKGGK